MNNLIVILLVVISTLGFSQVEINTTIPASQLDIKASNPTLPSNIDGILIPRISSFPIVNPTIAQNSMMVYLTTLFSGNPPGFYYWENSSNSWIPLGGKVGWGLNGNSTTNRDFLGTINDRDIIFRRFNVRAGLIGITNTSFGEESLKATNRGLFNSAFGSYSLNRNSTAEQNTAIGKSALRQNITGSRNVAVGTAAMYESLAGNENLSIGPLSLYFAKGNANVAIGFESLFLLNNPGDKNTAIGAGSGKNLLSGNNNLMIGNETDVPSNMDSNQMNIANTIYGSDIGSASSKIGVGELFPQTKLEINGAITLKNIGKSENAVNLITVGDRSYIKINNTLGIGQLSITNGLSVGQLLYIQYDDSVGSCLVVDSSNINCAGFFNMNGQDLAHFIWDGFKWVLVSFSNNN